MAYRDLILADSPSLYWPLDSTYGATDQSGNSRNGTAGGGITIGGFSGSPISGEATSTDFDNSDDRINSSYNPFTNGGTRTFAGWAYRDTSSGDDTLFGSDNGTLANAAIFHLVSGGTSVRFYANAGAASVTWASAWPGNTTWAHWALVFAEASDAVSLYVNGALVTTETMAAQWAATPGNFVVGRASGSFAPFDGKMAHVAVWERALTASEIQSHYRAGVDGSPANRNFVHEAGRGQ